MFKSVNNSRDDNSICDSVDIRAVLDKNPSQKDYLACFESEFSQIKDKLNKIEVVMNTKIDQIHSNLTDFNRNFSYYLSGLQLYSQQVEFPEQPNSATLELIASGNLDISKHDHIADQQHTQNPQVSQDELLSEQVSYGEYTVNENEPFDGTILGGKSEYNDIDELDEYTMINPQQNSVSAQKRANATPSFSAQKRSGQHSTSSSKLPNSHPYLNKPNSVSRTKRKQVINIKRYIDILPSKYRSQPHRTIIESILKELSAYPEGKQIHELMRDIGGIVGFGGGLSKSKWTEYLNVLEKSEVLFKIKNKGFVYVFNFDLSV
ncbi:hypothetical protein AYI70_g11039 [Smittium culicis]|uniref:Uncharacterized protein n=1 Tax=Smittium culicis TaxID=133412 RepID=A0A1R1X3L8_9FUNG|nr:hypothetical protein AYI70_g11039 [Smittium culicis]